MLRCISRGRNKKRGVSTILGILLMVGILLTSIIPLFMYVNEVNNYYDRTVVNLKISDQERSMEDLAVYAYGHNVTSTEIDIFLHNTGSISLNVTRIWVMEQHLNKTLIFNETKQLTPGQQNTSRLDIGEIIDQENDDYNYFIIEVTTTRGNKFASQTNMLHKTTFGWETWTQDYQIQLLIIRQSWGHGKYAIEIKNSTEATGTYYNLFFTEDVHGSYFTVFTLPRSGSYNVTAWIWNDWPDGPYIDSTEVVLTWTRPQTLVKFYYD